MAQFQRKTALIVRRLIYPRSDFQSFSDTEIDINSVSYKYL